MTQPLERLRFNAIKCRDLASSAVTPEARDVLTDLAHHYDLEVVAQEAYQSLHRHRRPAFKWPSV